MKKTLILLFVAALGAGTMSSCKKSSKGKMTGDWTVSSYTMSGTTVVAGTGGTTTSWSDVSDGTTVTSSYTDNSGVTTITTSTESSTYSILKDGTYSTTTTTVSTSTLDGLNSSFVLVPMQDITTTNVSNASGTWSFVKKNKSADVKTNERVVFNETAYDWTSTSVYVNTAAGTTDGTYTAKTTSSSNSSANDANYMGSSSMFTISESKKKTLTFVEVNTNTQNSGSNDGTTATTNPVETRTSDFTMTLTQP